MDIYEQLRRDEGVSATPYVDSRKHWTIGVGHNLDASGLCDEAITAQLAHDVRLARAACQTLSFWGELGDARQGALLNMMFNLGLPRFLKFSKMISALASQDYRGAAQEMRDSKWARQVGDRAQRLARQMETDTWQ